MHVRPILGVNVIGIFTSSIDKFSNVSAFSVKLMRWGSTGNSSFGVGATAYNFASHDENASYYYYQEPSAPLAASTGVFGGSQPRGVQAKKPTDKKQGRRIVGSNMHASRLNRQQKALTGKVECLEGTSRQTKPKARPPLIVCSGKGVCSPTGDSSGSEDRDDIISQRGDQNSGRLLVPDNNGNDVQLSNRSTQVVASVKTKRTNELESPLRHRTDEELEQIIRDLRDQVFQKQDNIQILKPVTNNYDDSRTQKHHRKHLKNPVERMEGTVVSVPVAASIESKTTNNGVLLQRPLSSSHLNRLVTETTIQMVVPAILSEAPVRTSSSNNLFSSLDLSSLRSSSSRSSITSNSSVGMENKSSRLNARSKQTSASTNVRRRRKARENGQYDDFNDGSESFLYLVDVDDNGDDPEAHSLSPVGPWIVDDFSDVVTTDTPRSPSTCYSVSSLMSEDLNIEGGAEWSSSDLAAMSPRSRLLYFSDCADDCETSRTSQMHWQSLRRIATCRTAVSEKCAKAESRPKRCSSANITMQGKPRSISSLSGIPKQKTSRRTRKRPQSGGAVRSQGQV